MKRECVLCEMERVNPDSSLLAEVWLAHLPGTARPWREVERVLARSGTEVTLQEVREHLRCHRPDQPNVPLRVLKTRAEELYNHLSRRDWELVRFVSQAWLCREEHIREWFFADGAGSLHSARSSCSRRLASLRHDGVLYRRQLDGGANKLGEGRVVYGLGRTGAKLLDMAVAEEGRAHRYLKHRDDVSTYRLGHDLGVVDVALELHESGRAGVELHDEPCWAEVEAHNLHTARSLAFDYRMPRYISEFGELMPARHHTMVSDGFAVVNVGPTSKPEKSIACPFLYEYDTGRRKVEHVAEQLFAYLGLDASRSVQRRFPHLDVEGYQVPLLVVTSAPGGKGGTRRRENLSKALLDRVTERRVELRAPIYIALREDVRSHGLEAAVHSVWGGSPRRLVDAVASHTRPLIEARRISRSTVLDVDLAAARPRQAAKDGLTASERAEKEADRLSSREALKAQQEEYDRWEAERLRKLAEVEASLRAGGQA